MKKYHDLKGTTGLGSNPKDFVFTKLIGIAS